MPSKPKKPCTSPGCPGFATNRGKCDHHAKAADLERGTAADRGYDSRWAHDRIDFLIDNPTCIDCGAPSEVPDHDPLSRRELVARGVTDPDHPRYLKPRCISCHNRKTGRTGK